MKAMLLTALGLAWLMSASADADQPIRHRTGDRWRYPSGFHVYGPPSATEPRLAQVYPLHYRGPRYAMPAHYYFKVPPFRRPVAGSIKVFPSLPAIAQGQRITGMMATARLDQRFFSLRSTDAEVLVARSRPIGDAPPVRTPRRSARNW